MRASPLSFALLALAAVPACANGGGRARVDAHVGTDSGPTMGDAGRDAGGTVDTGPARDMGTTPIDMGTTLVDMGTTPVDMGMAPVDAGRDAGMTISRDMGPSSDAFTCTSAAQCSDGLTCNGIERCNAGACQAGTAVVCDDGIPCTVDSCAEPGGSCNFVPSDALCPSGQTCSPTLGCRASSTCSESPCRLVSPQCGCPAGQACYPSGTARICSTAGTGMAGATCTTNANCAASYACINFSTGTTPANMCSHFCAADADCSGGLCIHTLNDGAGGTLPGVTLCTRSCDPIAQTGCAVGLYCDIFQERTGAMRYFTDCTAPSGSVGDGGICSATATCRPGDLCIDTGTGVTTCQRWCRYPGGTCPGGQTCFELAPAIIIGATDYGVCA